jgi:hypothetical protein
VLEYGLLKVNSFSKRILSLILIPGFGKGDTFST